MYPNHTPLDDTPQPYTQLDSAPQRNGKIIIIFNL